MTFNTPITPSFLSFAIQASKRPGTHHLPSLPGHRQSCCELTTSSSHLHRFWSSVNPMTFPPWSSSETYRLNTSSPPALSSILPPHISLLLNNLVKPIHIEGDLSQTYMPNFLPTPQHHQRHMWTNRNETLILRLNQLTGHTYGRPPNRLPPTL